MSTMNEPTQYPCRMRMEIFDVTGNAKTQIVLGPLMNSRAEYLKETKRLLKALAESRPCPPEVIVNIITSYFIRRLESGDIASVGELLFACGLKHPDLEWDSVSLKKHFMTTFTWTTETTWDTTTTTEDATTMCMKCKKTDLVNKMMMCGACKSVSYCSKECQKADWKHHKKQCKKC